MRYQVAGRTEQSGAPWEFYFCKGGFGRRAYPERRRPGHEPPRAPAASQELPLQLSLPLPHLGEPLDLFNV